MEDFFGFAEKMAIPPRLERGTYCLEGSCSIQLSYGTVWKDRESYLPRTSAEFKESLR